MKFDRTDRHSYFCHEGMVRITDLCTCNERATIIIILQPYNKIKYLLLRYKVT